MKPLCNNTRRSRDRNEVMPELSKIVEFLLLAHCNSGRAGLGPRGFLLEMSAICGYGFSFR
jgi:hypothetical protein